MKDVLKKYSQQIFVISLCLAIVVAGLSVYLIYDLRREMRRERALEYMYETEMYSSALRLRELLDAGEVMDAFYYACAAGECASRAHKVEENRLFFAIAESLRGGVMPSEEEKNALGRFLESGWNEGEGESEVISRSGERTRESVEEGSVLPAFVSAYREKRAKEVAGQVIGVEKTMHPAQKTTDDRRIFTCKNAYVVIDMASTLPCEFFVSLEAVGQLLSADECVDTAYKTLLEYTPKSMHSLVSLESYDYDDNSNFCNCIFSVRGVEYTVSVKNDSGAVVGFCTVYALK